MNRTLLISITVLSIAGLALAQPSGKYRYSLDLGGDWDISSPPASGEPEILDCGDIYLEKFAATPQPPIPPPLKKDDDAPGPLGPGFPFVAGGAPQPLYSGGNPAATEAQVLAQYRQAWDCDASDQLGLEFILPQNDLPVALYRTPDELRAAGIHVNPSWIAMSFDDDFGNGWYKSNDIPVTPGTAHRGHGDLMEVAVAAGPFGNWTWQGGVRNEDQIGVPLGMAGPGNDHHDDDVDALDVEDHQYWFFSPDHEANMGLDPGDIYMCDLNWAAGQNRWLAIDDVVNLGLIDDPTTPNVVEDADVDAWEFCALDKDAFRDTFGYDPDPSGAAELFLIGLFSVDEDDPDTPSTNENGGLSPGWVYASDLAGNHVGLMPYFIEGSYFDPQTGQRIAYGDIDGITVPEPATLALLALGCLGLLRKRR